MVQKRQKAAKPDAVAPKRRGRPRAYQPEIALGKALDLFRKDGLGATSLDHLSAATGMNRSERLQRVRRQARALHKELCALPRRRAGGDDRHLQRRAADPKAAGAHL